MISLKQCEKGEVILKENETGEVAYMIEKGSVEISREVNGEKIILATMKSGEIFGEMGMIDESPRSATVTAAEDTILKEIPRDEFFEAFKSDPDEVLPVLKSIFERLRDANVKIMQLEGEQLHSQTFSDLKPVAKREPEPVSPMPIPEVKKGPATIEEDPFFVGKQILPDLAYLEALTDEANAVLPKNPYPILDFPFLLGRKSNDPFSNNDLAISDKPPYKISRHHVKIIMENGKLGAIDRCSALGSTVDGKQIGGRSLPGPVFFNSEEGEIVLGGKNSPYKYKVYLKK